jgi:hypothetical protein
MSLEKRKLYGLLAVFDDADRLIEATHKIRDAGYERFDAFSPFPLEGLAEAMEFEPKGVSPICWIGGFLGAASGFALQTYDTLIGFPLNVGGRPYFSWPAYVPITFELMILFAGTFTFLGVLGLNRLPTLYHPAFNIEEFQKRNSSDGFFLLIEAQDSLFDDARTFELLQSLGAVRTYEVPHDP